MLDRQRPEPIRAEALERAGAGIRHGFFTRTGGVSSGIYAGLNVGVGSADQSESVVENRRRVAAWMNVPAERLVTLHQVHSPDVVHVTGTFDSARPKADAMVTDRPGLALGVLTADCGPVLFADAQARVIGAAHAGWKGAFSGVLENTVAAMERLGARRENIAAVLGPAISAANYEVGPEFVARFMEEDEANARYFTAGSAGHAMFDLNAYSLDRLARAGVRSGHIALCTYAEAERFYSYRRATHRGEADYGRQISAIVLEES